MESLNLASGFYFHVTGLLYFITLFEDFVAGAAAEQSLSAATLIRLVDLFPFSSFFFFFLARLVSFWERREPVI